MTDAQINETLAKAVGITPKRINNCLRWVYPDGTHGSAKPDFHNDFNACLKWIVPEIKDLWKIEFVYLVGNTICNLIFDNREYSGVVNGITNVESRAFCLAAIKYFEVKK